MGISRNLAAQTKSKSLVNIFVFHNTLTRKVSLGNELLAAWELIHLSKYSNARPKFVEEVNRILDAAKTEGLLLRLPGVLAFRFHCPS